MVGSAGGQRTHQGSLQTGLRRGEPYVVTGWNAEGRRPSWPTYPLMLLPLTVTAAPPRRFVR